MRGHDREDFEAFVAAQTPELLAFGRALTGEHHDALDLVQEALARMGERWARSSWDAPEAYVRTVMVRLNIDRFRRRRREWLVADHPERRDAATPVDSGSDLDAWLMEALQGLTPRQRSALAMRYLDDLAMADIATRLRCSEVTVRSHLSRGLAALRQQARPTTPTTQDGHDT